MGEQNVGSVAEETDADLLAEQAYKEQDEEAAGKKPEEKPAEPSEKKPEEEAPEPSEEEKSSEEKKKAEEEAASKETKEAEEAEIKKLLETNDEDLDEEQRVKKAGLIAANEKAQKEAASQKPEEELVQDHALKHNLTLEEAKKDLDETKKIVEKYKADPVQLAQALRRTQSGYDQLKAKEGKPQVIVRADPAAEIRQYAEANKDKILESFRKKFPVKSERMSDEEIMEESVAIAERDFEIWQKNENERITRDATSKREQLLAAIPEANKKFIPDIKAILSRTPDHEVIHESFDIGDIVKYARGSYYTEDRIKALEAAAFKRGKEDPKILGAKGQTSSGGATPKKGESQGSGSLSGDQQKRALEMFPAEDGYSDEQAFEAFKDTFKEELRKDKNFF